MGKLAERLSDPARSGVYRIETTEAVEEAAALNRHPLVRIALNGSAAAALEAAAAAGSRVIVVSGFEQFFREHPVQAQALVTALAAAAQARRTAGGCFFAAFLDPAATLPALAPLYNWSKKR